MEHISKTTDEILQNIMACKSCDTTFTTVLPQECPKCNAPTSLLYPLLDSINEALDKIIAIRKSLEKQVKSK